MTDLIYDSDITMGLPGRDIDDGLALLYLFGSPKIRLLGITSTFGNSSIAEVHPRLLSALEDLGRGDIPSYLEEKVLPWFAWIEQVYGLPGFHAWETTAALFLTNPQLFEPQHVLLRSNLDDLKRGFLRIDGAPAAPANNVTPSPTDSRAGDRNPWRTNVPIRIRDLPVYWQSLFDGWLATGAA